MLSTILGPLIVLPAIVSIEMVWDRTCAGLVTPEELRHNLSVFRFKDAFVGMVALSVTLSVVDGAG